MARESERVVDYLTEVELLAESVIADKQQIISLDAKRHQNREALRALHNSSKQTVCARMASSCRKPSPLVFDADIAERWETFVMDYNHYVNIAHHNDPPALRASLLLNLAGPDAMRRANSFEYRPAVMDAADQVVEPAESPNDPACLLRKFTEICDLPSNRILERTRLFSRKQQPGEPVECFIADLRHLSQRCRFGELRDELTRDILVNGMLDQKLRTDLMRKPDLTLNEAVHACRLAEVVTPVSGERGSGNRTIAVATLSVPRRAPSNSRPQSRPHFAPRPQGARKCPNCGYGHLPQAACPAIGKACNYCRKLNHFASVCRSRGNVAQPPRQVLNNLQRIDDVLDSQLEEDSALESDSSISMGDASVYALLHNQTRLPDPSVLVTVNNKTFTAKLDTGAKVSVISTKLFHKIRNNEQLSADRSVLRAYGGEELTPVGRVTFHCKLQKTSRDLSFFVLDCDCVPLLSNQACQDLGLVAFDSTVHEVRVKLDPVSEYPDLFDDKLGKLPLVYKIAIDSSVTPVCRPSHRVSFAMKDKVKAMLDKMVNLGVLEAVSEPTSWVSTMVATMKKGKNEIRVCINPKDLNTAIKRPHYPMRTVEDVAAQVGQATVFSVLDARSSFWQIPLHSKSSDLTTFATPFGRYKFLRMPFGISSASEVFQRSMEQLFAGLPCAIIVDDILVYGRDVEEHDRNLRRVLDRARQINLKLNPSKCRFRLSEVSYVGHIFTSQGLKPDPAKTTAISDFPAPVDVAGLQRFLGMVNYLGKFIPRLSELSAPLRLLTKKDVAWSWSPQHQLSFDALKKKLIDTPVLRFFDLKLPIVVTCDASRFGLGAACMQICEGDSLLPVSFASRTMTDTEQRYAQIEKELLAVVFACSKFRDFLYGVRFTVETDHQPLVTILNKPIHAAPARLQRMMLQLQRFEFDIVYKKGTEMHVADALSRAPLSSCAQHPYEQSDLHVLNVNFVPSKQLQTLIEHTAVDSDLQQLSAVILRDWPCKPHSLPAAVRPFFLARDELVLRDGIVIKGHKVVIPASLYAPTIL
ncbi:uncharacterized protein LOC129707187 [Leucoraja erinacea]|uniref:uncharacterized protein LOC129707187 n=1 Tax=Leucoraja erinaceus TaxID=7782 RepID=UPI002458F993|nr:uncharacterized protein LOC129707187 [Leucoraja erinacea]